MSADPTTTRQTLRLAVLSAGLSTPSSTRMLADQLAAAAASRLRQGGASVETTVVELREYAHDITDALLTRFPGERLSMVIENVRAADAVIAVTPVFNVGPSGLFKMFFDAVDRELWADKPVLLGATAGTPRHSLAIDYAIRPLFAYLKADVVPTAVFAASSDFGADADGSGEDQPLAARVSRAAQELTLLVGAADETRGAPTDAPQSEAHSVAVGLDREFSDFVPMDKLLGGR